MTDQDDKTLGSRSERQSQETLDEVSERWFDCLDRIAQTLESECSFDTALRAIRDLRDEYPLAAWRRAAMASTFANVLQGAPGTSLVRETIAEVTEILSDGFCEFSARELRVAAADVRDIVLDGESDAFGAPALHRRSSQDLYVVAREVGDRRAVQGRRDVLVSALAESEPTPILRRFDGSWMEPLGRAPLLAHHDAVRQSKRAQAGDRRAMQAMVLANTRLVYSIAKNAHTSFLETADYFQDGIRGLIRAIEKFDDAKDTQF